MNPSDDLSDAPLEGPSVHAVEALARTLCVAAGGNWDAKRHKRELWRRKARRALLAEAPAREVDALRWATALYVLGVVGLAAIAVALAP